MRRKPILTGQPALVHIALAEVIAAASTHQHHAGDGDDGVVSLGRRQDTPPSSPSSPRLTSADALRAAGEVAGKSTRATYARDGVRVTALSPMEALECVPFLSTMKAGLQIFGAENWF